MVDTAILVSAFTSTFYPVLAGLCVCMILGYFAVLALAFIKSVV